MPRLALGWGHWGDAEPMSGHLPPPIVNRDGHVSRGALTIGRLVPCDPVSLFDRSTVSLFRPGSGAGTARRESQDWPHGAFAHGCAPLPTRGGPAAFRSPPQRVSDGTVETSETDATSLLGAGPVRWPQEIRRSRKGFYICCCASCPQTKRFAMLATSKLPVPTSCAVCCAKVKQHAVRGRDAACRACCVVGRPSRGFRSHPMVFVPPGSRLCGCVPRRTLCPCLVRALWRNGGLSPRSSSCLLGPSNGAHRGNDPMQGPFRGCWG